MNPRSVLVLAPHTDDGELGAGATIARLFEEGAVVDYVAFSTGNPETGSNREECMDALAVLGSGTGPCGGAIVLDYPTRTFDDSRQEILDELIRISQGWGPHDLVLCPSRWDRHQDHQVIRAEAERAFPRTTLLGYELPWVCDGFTPTCLWPVERRHLQRKEAALCCYETQATKPYMRREIIWGLAAIRGMQAGVRFAEAFEVVRWVNS